MTTYNTGNPIGSTAVKDLYDNAENLDVLVNDKSKLSRPDRLGVPRKTWHAIEEQADQQEAEFNADQTRRESEFVDAQADKQQRFNLLLANSGYEYLADYAAGIEVTEYNQVIRDGVGELWRVSVSTELPYTTDGTGLPEGGAFVAVGDADIRNDLAAGVGAGKGGLLVRGSVIYVDAIADLQALDTSELVDGQAASVQGSEFRWSLSSGVWNPTEQVSIVAFDLTSEDNSDALESAIRSGWPIFIPEDVSVRITRLVTSDVTTSIEGPGTIFIDQSPFVGGIHLTGGYSVVRGVSFRGNGEYHDVSGVFALRMEGESPRISSCRFSDFRLESVNRSSSLISTVNTRGAVVSENYFAETNYGFNDISHGASSGNTVTRGNVSFSHSDYHIGAVSWSDSPIYPGALIRDTSHHIITDNIHIKNAGNKYQGERAEGRHGILVHYSDNPGYCVIRGNIIANCGRHGIYVRSNFGDVDAGPDIVDGNIVRFCGGQSSYSLGFNYAIRPECGRDNTIFVRNNIVEYSGYYPDGSKREHSAAGIGVVTNQGALIIEGNSISVATNSGIRASSGSSDSFGRKVRKIVNNTIRGCEGRSALYVGLPQRSVEPDAVYVLDNDIEHSPSFSDGVTTGIFIATFADHPSREGLYYGAHINGNNIKTEGDNSVGISVANRYVSTFNIRSNRITGAQWGISSHYDLENNLTITFAHLDLGKDVVVDENVFINVSSPVRVRKSTGHIIAFIGANNKFINCTNLPDYNFFGATSYCIGRVTKVISDDEYNVEVILNRTPNQQAWLAGDRIINANPSAGSYTGWVCVESGEPGTWKGYGLIEE